MKIHKLKLFNMASLKGHHEIDFNQISKSSNLFAITGKTGAGKSTILNCISLALYGDVYKKGSTSSDFITLGEPFGEVELLFSTNSTQYRASWKLRIKKKNGETLKKPQLIRTIYKVLAGGEQVALDANIEEITNLNFNQFCKTTILNQGEFSRFLTSNFTERKEILEKFYEGENLDLLNAHLKLKLKKATSKKDEKENQIIGISQSFSDLTINKNDVVVAKKQFNTISNLSKSLAGVQYSFNDIQKMFVLINTNKSRLEEFQFKITSKNALYNTESKELDQLSTTLDNCLIELSNKKPTLNEAIKKEVQRSEIQKRSTQITKRIEELFIYKGELNNNSIKIQEKTSKVIENETIIISKFPYIKNYCSKTLSADYNQSTLLLNQLNSHSKKLHSETNKLITYQEKQDKTQSVLTRITSELNNFNESNVEQQLTKNQERLSKLSHLLISLRSKLNSSQKLKKESTELTQKTINFDKSTAKEKLTLDALRVEKEDLEKGKKLFQLTQALNLCYHESIKNNECILCGNEGIKEITLTTQFSKAEIKKLEDRLIENELKIEKQNTTLNEIKVLNLSTQKEIIKTNYNFKEIESQALLDWNHLINTDSPLLILSEETIDSLTKQKEHLEKVIKTSQDSINQIHLKQEEKRFIQKDLKQNLMEIERYTKQIKMTQAELDKDLPLLLNEFNKYEIIINGDHENGIKSFKQLKDRVLELDAIASNKEILNIKSKNIRNEISENLNEEQKLLTETHKIEKELHLINHFILKNTKNGRPSEELMYLEDTMTTHQSLFHRQKEKLKLIEIELAELRSKIDNFTEQISTSELLMATIYSKMLGDISKLDLSSKVDIPSFDTLIKILGKIKQIDLNNIDSQILQETGSQLKLIEQDINDQRDERQEYLSKTSTLLKRKQENEHKILSIQKDLKLILEQLKQLDELNQLIGKDEFRNYILSIIETLLLDQTNQELKILCQGRYSIEQTNKKNKMSSEFKLVDYYYDGQERSISTLSGGETFLVSLAMAMALAELTRGSAQIDSLFIDEGFGTLDSDSIQEVYELLLEIQHSGKQIGIISHISELTSRIPVNINLVKNSSGLSEINVLLN